jgi:major intracellular serine protease
MKLFYLSIALGYLMSPIMAANTVNGKPTVIAVVDTGFGYKNRGGQAKLCRYGHKDFSGEGKYIVTSKTEDMIPEDVHGHGTNIVGVIEEQLQYSGVNYCIVIVKFWSEKNTGSQNVQGSIRSLRFVNNIKADVINYSGGGPDFNEEEYVEVTKFLDRKGVFVASAGNNGKNIDYIQNYEYPAKYDKRIIVVGNVDRSGKIANNSNYGKSITRWEIGVNVKAYGLIMSGTSQATATATGKIVAGMGK